eukprot:jgi/Tetstr1/463540/TSEL_008419.t1
MPLASLNGVELFYELHCSKHGTLPPEAKPCACHTGNAYYVLLIMGFQARGEGWRYNLDALLSYEPPSEGEVICCSFDNRGVGASSHPQDRKAYSTAIMARDALALMDLLGWRKAHIFGHSMGGMIACKVASMAPNRVHSLALISVTGGRWQALKSLVRKLPGHIKHGAITAKTKEAKARLTLYAHFSRMWLKESVETTRRRKEQLIEEYMANMEKDDYKTDHGSDGQLSAVWGHHVSSADRARIMAGGFPILVIHGRKDAIAHIGYAERLSKALGATSLFTSAGHFITRESDVEVNHALLSLLQRVHSPAPEWRPGASLSSPLPPATPAGHRSALGADASPSSAASVGSAGGAAQAEGPDAEGGEEHEVKAEADGGGGVSVEDGGKAEGGEEGRQGDAVGAAAEDAEVEAAGRGEAKEEADGDAGETAAAVVGGEGEGEAEPRRVGEGRAARFMAQAAEQEEAAAAASPRAAAARSSAKGTPGRSNPSFLFNPAALR